MNTNNTEKEKGKKKGKVFLDAFTKRKKDPNFFLSVFVTCIKFFVIALLIIGFAGFGAVLGVAKAYVDGTPELDIARIEDQDLTSFIYDKNGDLITEYKGLEYRIWAPIEEIPITVQNALIATEDIRFYTHEGLDYKRLIGAFVNNLKNEAVQGGSTITQQLIKNTLLSPEQTYKRKIQEAYLSTQLEQEYDKDDILEAYLNTIYLGGGNYGIKAAAENYFGKELHELTLRESASIVGITKNPYRFDLRLNFYNRESPEISYARTNLVLRLMYENGFISKSAYDNAKFDDKNPDSPKNAGFVVLEESNHQQLYKHPYFVEYVIDELTNELMSLYGWERKQATNLIQSGGLQIYTTLDPEIQTTLEDTIYNYDKYPKTKNTKDNVKREKIGNSIVEIEQPQAAAVIFDHNTGELKALVGGRSEPLARFWNNRADGDWNPGSAIKPLSVYSPFIEAGYPGGYIIEDVPVPINGWIVKSEVTYPSNSGKKFKGPVTAKTAVVHSYNVSSARTLMERVGIENSKNKLKELGITAEQYVGDAAAPSALALGGGEGQINMIDVTAAYGALANKGVYTEPTSISKVFDKDNKMILDNTVRPTITAFKESTAFIITDWLKGVMDDGTGRKADFGNMSIAGKTGTNDKNAGVFFAGYTPYYTATVMISHDNVSTPLESDTSGSKSAAPLWKSFMEKIHENLENKPFYESVPEGVKSVTICPISGLLPSEECSETIREYFPSNAVPKEKCNMHQKVTICGYSGKLPSPYCPEGHLITKSVFVIPEDSVYQKLTDKELQNIKELSGAFRSLTDLDKLDYNNPDHKEQFCSLHTDSWNSGEEQRKGLIEQANQLIKQITDNMSRYNAFLTQSQKDSLIKAINKLNEALAEEPVKLPKPGDPYYTEVPPFKPEAIQAPMDNLRKTYENVFNAELWNLINTGGNTGGDTNNSGNNGSNGDDNNANSGNNGN
ncbi:MAG: hypothetical protein GX783_08005, partial [Clostridiales bacterium]|nr:hypothetical protein [Clostridiales bacterium]